MGYGSIINKESINIIIENNVFLTHFIRIIKNLVLRNGIFLKTDDIQNFDL